MILTPVERLCYFACAILIAVLLITLHAASKHEQFKQDLAAKLLIAKVPANSVRCGLYGDPVNCMAAGLEAKVEHKLTVASPSSAPAQHPNFEP